VRNVCSIINEHTNRYTDFSSGIVSLGMIHEPPNTPLGPLFNNAAQWDQMISYSWRVNTH